MGRLWGREREIFWLLIVIMWLTACASFGAPVCATGPLSSVLGTSCTDGDGDITFAFASYTTSGSEPFDASQIEFVPDGFGKFALVGNWAIVNGNSFATFDFSVAASRVGNISPWALYVEKNAIIESEAGGYWQINTQGAACGLAIGGFPGGGGNNSDSCFLSSSPATFTTHFSFQPGIPGFVTLTSVTLGHDDNAPEPTSLVLLGSGLAVLSRHRFRKSAKQLGSSRS